MTDISYILRQCTITSTKQIHDIQQQQNVVKKKHNAIYSTLRSSRDIKLTVQRRGKEIELELTKDESGKFGFEITRTSDCLTVSQSNNAKLQIGDRIINAVSEGNGISNSADQGTGSNQCFLETARIKTEKQEALFKELDNHIREEVQRHNAWKLDHEKFMAELKKWMLEHSISTSSHKLAPLGQQQCGDHGLKSGTAFSPPTGPK